jgi:AraC-like DNA-binding protein
VTSVWTTSVPTSAGALRVLPDAAVDLVFSGGCLLSAGPDTGPVTEQLPAGVVLGFQLAPGAAEAILHAPASAVAGCRVDIADLWGQAGRDLADRLAGTEGLAKAADLIESAIFENAAADVDALAGPLRRMLRAAGQVDTRELGLGDRQLRRRCVAAYGYPPRTLRRILRFQRFLEDLSAHAAAPLSELAGRAGYADQSHLAHDVGEFSGLTPAALQRAASYPLAGEWAA